MWTLASESTAGDAAPVAARYFAASGGARARSATLSLGDAPGTLLLSLTDDATTRDIPVRELDASERFVSATRTVQLAGGDMLEIDDGPALSRLLTAAGNPDAIVTRWQHSKRAALTALIITIVLAIAGYRWGLPVAADFLAHHTSNDLAALIDRAAIAQLDQQTDLTKSRLDTATQDRLRQKFSELTLSLPPAQPVSLVFRRMGNVANAFALPGGTIIVLDGLVNMAPNDDAVLGVLAHELGHVEHRHGLRTLFRSAAVSALAAWYFGDFSSLATVTATLTQLNYSREFEAEADSAALLQMQRHHIDPRQLAELFRRIRDQGGIAAPPNDEATSPEERKEKPGKRWSIPDFLSTHPDIDRRIERFERAGGVSAGKV